MGSVADPEKIVAGGDARYGADSDARMSGTSYGACVLHVAPESAVGGPLGWVEDGDMIELDIENGRLDLRVSEEEMARRRSIAPQNPRAADYPSGYAWLYRRHVMQANEGCDFDFASAARARRASRTFFSGGVCENARGGLTLAVDFLFDGGEVRAFGHHKKAFFAALLFP